MNIRTFSRRIVWIFACALSLYVLPAWSQMGDQEAQHLSAEETQRLLQILDTPIDPNALKSTLIPLFRAKDIAALKLGDFLYRERNSRAWMKVDSDISPKWSLWLTLNVTGQYTEAGQLGKELLSEVVFPSSKVRLRAGMMQFALDRGQLKLAAEMMDSAEKIIRYDFPTTRRFTGLDFHEARARGEFHTVKAQYLMRIGKWADGIENAKLAVAQGKESVRLENTIQVQEWKDIGRFSALRALISLSSHQRSAGLYSDAEWTLRDAYKLSRAYGFNEKMMGGFYNVTSDLYNATGQYQDALLFSQRSEKLALDAGFPKGSPPWLFAQMRVIKALAGQDQWPQALAKLEQRDDAANAKGTLSVANPAFLRTHIYLKNARHDEALNVMTQSLKFNIANFGEAHYFTAVARGLNAVALWRTGAGEAARPEFEKSLQNFSAPESLTGDFVEDAFQLKTKRFILQSYMQLLAQTAASQPKDAETIFQIADQLSASSVQQALSDAAVRSGVTVPGLSDIIRQEQDAKNEVATLNGYIAGQGTEEDKRRNAQVVEQMRLRIRELENLRKGYKAQIQKGYPEYFQLIQPKSPSHTDIAQQLKPDELFISVLPIEDKTYVWAIEANGKVGFAVADLGEKQAQALVERIRKTLDVAHLGERAPAFDYASAYQLYQSLLLPFERELAGKKHLIVATSGALARLPMAVLTRSPFSGADASQAPWLVRDLAVSHVPTANSWVSLKRLGKQPSSPQPLMAWGDPLFDVKPVQVPAVAPTEKATAVRSVAKLRSADLTARNVIDPETYVTYSKLSPLPETRDEVLELAKILGANPQQDVILGAEATRASVLKSSASGQLGKKQVVVFATHGLLAGDLPNLNQPALAMASTANPAESPLLTLEDVLSLKLNADWVVLSACNTAGADGKAEDALTGLARGFFFAGSRSLLVTHWSVESESAMLLTTHTFAAYKKDPALRRSEALRLAMLETMKSKWYAHPTYWAPYALVGEGGR